MGAITFKDVEPQQYDHIYYHDYHGWRATKEDSDEGFNAFTAGSNEYLRAVSFYTATDSVDYTIKIYDTFQGGQLQDELHSQTGYQQYTGFHTVNLSTPLLLQNGNDFYVYLSLSDGGQAFDRTSEVPVLLVTDSYLTIVNSTSNPNESFYRDGTQWQDMYYYEDPAWTGSDGSANLCIKALTVDESNVPVELTSFTAVGHGNKIQLEWTTATETNNHQFEIYRREIEGSETSDWRLIGYREGAGTTTESQSYTYQDEISNLIVDAFEYKLKQIDFNGQYAFSDIVTVDNLSPNEFVLEQNYPNPFNPSTIIKYSIANSQFITLKVYDVLGNEVSTLVNEEKDAGNYEVEFSATGLASGIYLYIITSGDFISIKKMVLMK
jgi:hypothetical protein